MVCIKLFQPNFHRGEQTFIVTYRSTGKETKPVKVCVNTNVKNVL